MIEMKQIFLKLSGVIMLVLLTLNGCKKDDPEPETRLVSEGKEILYFKIQNPAIAGVLDTVNKKITLLVPAGTNVTSMVTDISLAAGHSVTPASGTAQNFTNPVVYTVKRPNNTTTNWTVSVEYPEVTVTTDIEQSTTWTANKTYLINDVIEISNNSILTIEPGTTIKFGPNGSLSVGYYSNATVIANGTATNPITFTSSALAPTAGAWEGIYLHNKTLNNSSFTYCKFQYAGSDASYGAVNILGADVIMNNCIVSNSGSFGILTDYNSTTLKGGFVSFSNNTISNTEKYAIVIDAMKLSTIGDGNVFTNAKGVHVEGDFRSTTPQTWKNLNVPYIIDEEIDIDGNLTIAAGTTFKFEATGHFEIGYFATTTFVADGGSASTPITFTSNASSPTAGIWEGLVFFGYTQTNSKMNFCVVDYAGSVAAQGAVDFRNDASIIFTNNIVRNSANYGITLDAQAGFQAFNNNNISNCNNHLISISILHLPDLGTSNTFAPVAGKGIEVSGDANYSSPVIWKSQTANFYVIGGESDIDGDVTIEPGCNFKFDNSSSFWFGYYANTKITAVGTSTSKISFSSASASPVAGTWEGLYFDSRTQTNSALSYCDIKHTGLNDEVAIYTEVSFPVNNTSITDYSTTHAAEYKTGITVPAGTGNNFTWYAN
jgi:hypothetical protein